MKVQVLIATMYREDYSLLEEMNIQTDAVVINQCDRNEVDVFNYNGHKVKWISTTNRGVGRSRNLAIINSDAEILVFADDDIRYCDGYEEKIVSAFKHEKCDLMVFNFQSLNCDRPEYIDKKTHKLKWHNCLKYGAFRISVRKNALFEENLGFSFLFGGGAKYQSGEDNLFIMDFLRTKRRCMASNVILGTVKQEESTWFKGYNEQYYYDRGALFAALFRKKAVFALCLFELKSFFKRKKQVVKLTKRVKYQIEGARKYRLR